MYTSTLASPLPPPSPCSPEPLAPCTHVYIHSRIQEPLFPSPSLTIYIIHFFCVNVKYFFQKVCLVYLSTLCACIHVYREPGGQGEFWGKILGKQGRENPYPERQEKTKATGGRGGDNGVSRVHTAPRGRKWLRIGCRALRGGGLRKRSKMERYLVGRVQIPKGGQPPKGPLPPLKPDHENRRIPPCHLLP